MSALAWPDTADASAVRRRLAWQAPVALALAGLAFAVLGAVPTAVPFCYLALVTPELVRVDVRWRLIPNALVVWGYPLAMLAPLTHWLSVGEAPFVAYSCGAAAFAFLLALHYAGGMGMGDVKLAGLLGLTLGGLGASVAFTGFAAAFVAAGVMAIALQTVTRDRGTMQIPFGPFLLAGFWAAPVLGAVVSG